MSSPTLSVLLTMSADRTPVAASKSEDERAKLIAAFVECDATDDQAKDVAKVLQTELGIVSLTQFFVWFKKHDLKEWFDEQQPWRKNGPLYCAIDMAWAAAEESHVKRLKHQEEENNGDETRPIDPEINQST